MINYLLVMMLIFCCNLKGHDENRERVMLHNQLNADFNLYLTSNKSRYVPIYGGGSDLGQSIYLKRKYSSLLSMEMRDESEWQNYVVRLQTNMQGYDTLRDSLIKLSILWFQLTFFSALLSVVFKMSYDHDYYVSYFSIFAGSEAILRTVALGILMNENRKLKKIINSKFPRLKQIYIPDQQFTSANVENGYTLLH